MMEQTIMERATMERALMEKTLQPQMESAGAAPRLRPWLQLDWR